LFQSVNEVIPIIGLEKLKEEGRKREEIKPALLDILSQAYAEREKTIGADHMREIEKLVMLRVIDTAWIEQLHNMDVLQEGIGLRGYGGRDPLIEYKIEGYGMFQEMMRGVREQILGMVLKVELRGEEEAAPRKRVVSYGAAQKAVPAHAAVKVGRNDPCPCGSGKKYKKCCLKS
jgi:preprotein translocase subunit SecA